MKKFIFVLVISSGFTFSNFFYCQENFWQQLSVAQIDTLINSLEFAQNNNIIITTPSGLYISTDRGVNWELILPCSFTTQYQSICRKENGYLFVTRDHSGVSRSHNNGLSWEYTGHLTSTSINVVSANHIGDVFVGTAGDGLFGSTDNGNIWWSIQSFPHHSIFSFGVNSIGYLFGGSANFGVFRSKDNGISWVKINNGIGDIDINEIKVDSLDNILLSTPNGVFKSTNNGEEWFPINKGITNFVIRCMALNSLGHLFIGTNDGVFCSKDDGQNWNQVNSGLLHFIITSLNFDSDGFIYAGSWGGGLYKSVLTTTDVMELTNNFPNRYLLSQNYPNPFNPSTIIRFSIPSVETHRDASLLTTLKVFDVLGKEVATLVNEEKPAGNYEVEFNPESSIRHPASGIYFYQLKAGDFVETKKMIYLK